MKQLVVLSGKGGTGKTCVTASLAHLAVKSNSPIPVVLADADVDAANLELLVRAQIYEKNDFPGGQVAIINEDQCKGCGWCFTDCRFDAIQPNNGVFSVDPIACEGCAACFYTCLEEAISMHQQTAGQWFKSDSRYGTLFHAALRPGQENSGKLVTLVKQHARLLAMDQGNALVLVDGPPGIGCPVISAISGADMALIVTEPGRAGVHDMQRVLKTVKHFEVPALVCINKADIYPEGITKIETFCNTHDIKIIGRIPFDQSVVEAMAKGEPVTEYQPGSPASRSLETILVRILNELFGESI